MTAPVDVLAVMTSTIRTLSIGGVPDEAQQMHKARAAVAELIEAVGVFRTHYSTEGCAFPDCNLCKRSKAAEERLDAALVRVQGGAE